MCGADGYGTEKDCSDQHDADEACVELCVFHSSHLVMCGGLFLPRCGVLDRWCTLMSPNCFSFKTMVSQEKNHCSEERCEEVCVRRLRRASLDLSFRCSGGKYQEKKVCRGEQGVLSADFFEVLGLESLFGVEAVEFDEVAVL